MPSHTEDHYIPAPRKLVEERKLITRWLDYSRENHGLNQNEAVKKMNEHFGTRMRAWQIIRWRRPHSAGDEVRAINIDVVEYMAKQGGVAQIFRAYGASEDSALKDNLATIWYHPPELVRASVKRVVAERMADQVTKPTGEKDVAKAIVSIFEYVAQNLDLILDGLGVDYSAKALTKKNKRLIAEEIYSIVGFDFSPSR